MKNYARAALGFIACLATACGGAGNAGGADASRAEPRDHPPVLINAEAPVEYPPDLFEGKVEADVVLRLFVDAEGTVAPESTQVAESSGHAALDSAALAGVPRFRFAPALRRGKPTATAFLQPVHFRHPEGTSSGDNP